jgi:zinc-ribbon domain
MTNCAQCGSPIEPGDAFCSSCGARAAQAAPEPQPEPAPPTPPAPSAVAQSYVPPGPNFSPPRTFAKPDALGQVTRNGWILCGGAAAIAIGSLLPWVSVSSSLGFSISSSPQGGSTVLFLVLVAGALAAGWPSIRSDLSTKRLIGLTAVVAVLTIFAVTNWSDLVNLENKYSGQGVSINGGVGLYLYTLGVVALWVCVVRLFRARQRPLAANMFKPSAR